MRFHAVLLWILGTAFCVLNLRYCKENRVQEIKERGGKGAHRRSDRPARQWHRQSPRRIRSSDTARKWHATIRAIEESQCPPFGLDAMIALLPHFVHCPSTSGSSPIRMRCALVVGASARRSATNSTALRADHHPDRGTQYRVSPKRPGRLRARHHAGQCRRRNSYFQSRRRHLGRTFYVDPGHVQRHDKDRPA